MAQEWTVPVLMLKGGSVKGGSSAGVVKGAGVIGIFFCGTGEEEDDRNGIIQNLWAKFSSPLRYIYTVAGKLAGTDGKPLVSSTLETQAAFDEVTRALQRDSKEKVDIFGYSRGAAMAVVLATRLDKVGGINVSFMGLLDPVSVNTDLTTRKQSDLILNAGEKDQKLDIWTFANFRERTNRCCRSEE